MVNKLYRGGSQHFLFYRLGEYRKSIGALEHAIDLSPASAYAHTLMARNWMLLARNASELTKRRYTEKAREMQRQARKLGPDDDQRSVWLDRWMKRRI